jgi:hypothetical protein
MKTARLIAGGACALLLLFAALGPTTFAQGRERIAYVSAWDEKTRAPITGLGPEAFAIREDGNLREILRVTPATSPMAVAVLVDNSQAAQKHLGEIRRALTSFLKAINGIGPTSIIGIADRPTILRDYTTDQKLLQDGVGKVFAMPGSGATLLDAIVEVSKGLARREEDRVAIVMLTTENIEFSNRHYDDVLDELKKGGAQMHAVILNTPAGTSLSDEARNRAFVLDRGPIDSGGTRIDVLASQAFEQKMLELAAILKGQHRVVYSRPETLIPPEKFEVKSSKPGIEVSGGPARGQAAK